MPPSLYQPLLELAATSRIITVNDRLARRLRGEYERAQLAAGKQAWVRPEILSCEVWQAELIELLLPELLLPTQLQEQALWEEVIRSSDTNGILLQVPATARRAREAHTLLRQFDTSFSASGAGPDPQIFLKWQAAYQRLLQQHQLGDRAELTRLLATALRQQQTLNYRPLLLAGFDELKPDLKALLGAFESVGITVTHWEQPQLASHRQLYLAADPEAEVRAAGCWAREQLRTGAERVAIVVPELQRYHSLLHSCLCAELQPQSLLSPEKQELPFTISLGGALADEGVVASALALLSWESDWLLDDLSYFLRSPYFGSKPGSESFRAGFELRLRKKRLLHWTPALVNKQFQRQESTGSARQLQSGFTALQHWCRLRRNQLPGAWSEQILQLLPQIGWPGERTLNSREFQAVEKFKGVLQGLASLDGILGRISRTQAVSLLQRLCSEETFQPEASGKRLEVVGLLEAGGMIYDKLWVVGLHDGLLPGPLRPNPFLPVRLQQQLRMPHADLQHETAYALIQAERLFHAAGTVVASCPRQEGDQQLRLHHLLHDWPELSAPLPVSRDPRLLLAASRPQPECLDDSQAPAIHSRKVTSGGTALLKDQALCPFRAFAHHRLQANAPETADVGLDGMMRGTLAHNLLEQFWRACGSHQALAALSGEVLAQQLELAAEQALAAFERSEKRDLPPRQRQLESERLCKLGREWLQLELQRAPFEVLVDELEKPQTISLGNLLIRTRIDRIDRLGDGSRAIIDYKTGRSDPLQWLDERLTEPQLPIYACSNDSDDIGAVLFASVRSGSCRFRGLVAAADAFPGLPEKRLTEALAEAGCENLPLVRQRWSETLNRLAGQFLAGAAAVDPIDWQKACNYCDLTPLCRILEGAAVVEGGEDD